MASASERCCATAELAYVFLAAAAAILIFRGVTLLRSSMPAGVYAVTAAP